MYNLLYVVTILLYIRDSKVWYADQILPKACFYIACELIVFIFVIGCVSNNKEEYATENIYNLQSLKYYFWSFTKTVSHLLLIILEKY